MPIRFALPVRLLPDDLRAQMHAQLAALERAGVPPAQAVGLLDLPGEWKAAATRTSRALARGQSLADAGAAAGLFTPLETSVLRAAIHAGSPAIAHERLGAAAALRAKLAKQVRARLLLPLFVLALALFLQPLPALIAGYLSGGAYLLRSAGTLVLLAACVALIGHLRQLAAAAPDSPGRLAIEAVALKLPVLGPLLRRTEIQRGIENLALLLESGLSVFEALPLAAGSARFQAIRAQFHDLLPLVQGGAPLATAVRALDGIDHRALAGMIATGEGSGQLPEMLTRWARAEAQEIQAQQAQLAAWLPRIAYFIIAAWMAQGLLGGASALIGRRDL